MPVNSRIFKISQRFVPYNEAKASADRSLVGAQPHIVKWILIMRGACVII